MSTPPETPRPQPNLGPLLPPEPVHMTHYATPEQKLVEKATFNGDPKFLRTPVRQLERTKQKLERELSAIVRILDAYPAISGVGKADLLYEAAAKALGRSLIVEQIASQVPLVRPGQSTLTVRDSATQIAEWTARTSEAVLAVTLDEDQLVRAFNQPDCPEAVASREVIIREEAKLYSLRFGKFLNISDPVVTYVGSNKGAFKSVLETMDKWISGLPGIHAEADKLLAEAARVELAKPLFQEHRELSEHLAFRESLSPAPGARRQGPTLNTPALGLA